jgi:transcription antitermination factor NusG
LALPDEQINVLRKGLLQSSNVEPHPYLTEGRNVRVKDGPFEGLEGILVRHKGDFRVVLTIKLIRRSVLVDVDAASIEILPPDRS